MKKNNIPKDNTFFAYFSISPTDKQPRRRNYLLNDSNGASASGLLLLTQTPRVVFISRKEEDAVLIQRSFAFLSAGVVMQL